MRCAIKMSSSIPKRLRRVVVKQEFVELTGDYRTAIVLQQFLYWSERVRDFDEFIAEENERLKNIGKEQIEPTNGWIYKKARELAEECMFVTRKKVQGSTEYKNEIASDPTIMSYIDQLVDLGLLEKRTNPKMKWDRVYQYRVNLLKLQADLMELGYPLEGYKMPINIDISQLKKFKFEHGETLNANKEILIQDKKIEIRNTENFNALPEITNRDYIYKEKESVPVAQDSPSSADKTDSKDLKTKESEPKVVDFEKLPKEAVRLAQILAKGVKANHPKKPKRECPELEPTPYNYQLYQWADQMRLLNDTGPKGAIKDEKLGYEWAEIEELINFALDNEFWKKNAVSGDSFRRNILKINADFESSKEKTIPKWNKNQNGEAQKKKKSDFNNFQNRNYDALSLEEKLLRKSRGELL